MIGEEGLKRKVKMVECPGGGGADRLGKEKVVIQYKRKGKEASCLLKRS